MTVYPLEGRARDRRHFIAGRGLDGRSALAVPPIQVELAKWGLAGRSRCKLPFNILLIAASPTAYFYERFSKCASTPISERAGFIQRPTTTCLVKSLHWSKCHCVSVPQELRNVPFVSQCPDCVASPSTRYWSTKVKGSQMSIRLPIVGCGGNSFSAMSSRNPGFEVRG